MSGGVMPPFLMKNNRPGLVNSLRRLLVLFVAAALFITVSPPPAHAFSSINACLTNPECAAAIGATAASSAGTGTGMKVAVGAGVAIGGAAIAQWVIPDNETQPLADKFSPSVVGGQCPNVLYEIPILRTNPAPWFQANDIAGYLYVRGPIQGFSQFNPSQFSTTFTATGSNGVQSTTVSFLAGGSASRQSVRPAWGQPADTCGNLGGNPAPSELEPFFPPSRSTTPSPVYSPNGEPKYPPFTFPSGGVYIAPNAAPNNKGFATVPPGYQVDPSTGVQSPIGSPSGSGSAPTQGQDTDPDNSDFGAAPADPQIVAPATFSRPNFVSYALTVFSNKFPLDAFGTLPASGSNSGCPNFTFYGRQHEVCFVTQAIGTLKIPTVLGFFIWAVLAL